MNISKEILEQKRSPEELGQYVRETLSEISKNKELKKEARLRTQLFKELFEEVYPLSIFCIEKYKGVDVVCYPVIGSQGYDAIIENQDGSLIEVIELTWPVDGQKEHFERKQLNDQGHTDFEVWNDNDRSKRQQLIDIILKAAYKKSFKDYEEPEGSSLVFILGITPFFGMSEIDHQEDIDLLVEELSKIEFKANSVYLLLLPINKLIVVRNGVRDKFISS